MSCHRFDRVRCRRFNRFPVIRPIVYTIIRLPVYGGFSGGPVHSADSNCLTIPVAASCTPARNYSQDRHNSRTGRPVHPRAACFPAPLFNCPLSPHSSPKIPFAHSWLPRAVRPSPRPGILIPLPGHSLWSRHPPPPHGQKVFPGSRRYP